jgi:hypothetical protein
VDVGVEVAVRLDLREALLGESLLERSVDEADSILNASAFRITRVGDGFERPLEIVEHWEELLYETLVGARGQALLVARYPLAVVLEFGRDPL